MPMIHVLAIITAHPGMRDRILEAWRGNAPAVRAEDGCLQYEAVVDVADVLPGMARFGDDTFVVVERWSSPAALQAHAVAPHMKAYASQVKAWTANRAIHVLDPA
jgi:quinol monooxygenase YgiN